MENNDKKPAKRRHAKRARFVRPASVPVNMRIPADVWEKLDWKAAELGIERPDLIRISLADAVRTAKPPTTPNSLVIEASVECREAFTAAGQTYTPPITAAELALELLLNCCRKRLGQAPEYRNGKWVWKPEA
jgi:hypothetical protein